MQIGTYFQLTFRQVEEVAFGHQREFGKLYMILFYHCTHLSLLMNRLAPFWFYMICHLGLITCAELGNSVHPELSICAQHTSTVTVRFDVPRFARPSSHAAAAFGSSVGRAPWSQ